MAKNNRYYDDFQVLDSTFDYIPAKALESRLESIKESNEAEGGIYTDEISEIESIIAQFEKNGDSVKDLTRYSVFDKSWMFQHLEDAHNWNSDSLPEVVRNNIDWDDVKTDLLDEMMVIYVEDEKYYYEEN